MTTLKSQEVMGPLGQQVLDLKAIKVFNNAPTDDFAHWKLLFETTMKMAKVWMAFVDPSKIGQVRKEEIEERAKYYLYHAVSKDILFEIKDLESVECMWTRLNERFGKEEHIEIKVSFVCLFEE